MRKGALQVPYFLSKSHDLLGTNMANKQRNLYST